MAAEPEPALSFYRRLPKVVSGGGGGTAAEGGRGPCPSRPSGGGPGRGAGTREAGALGLAAAGLSELCGAKAGFS